MPEAVELTVAETVAVVVAVALRVAPAELVPEALTVALNDVFEVMVAREVPDAVLDTEGVKDPGPVAEALAEPFGEEEMDAVPESVGDGETV